MLRSIAGISFTSKSGACTEKPVPLSPLKTTTITPSARVASQTTLATSSYPPGPGGVIIPIDLPTLMTVLVSVLRRVSSVSCVEYVWRFRWLAAGVIVGSGPPVILSAASHAGCHEFLCVRYGRSGRDPRPAGGGTTTRTALGFRDLPQRGADRGGRGHPGLRATPGSRQ